MSKIMNIFNNAKNKTLSFQSAALCILFLFALFIGLFLSYYSVCYSYLSPADYSRRIYPVRDNIWLNLLFYILAVLLCAVTGRLFSRVKPEKQRRAGYLFLGFFCLLYAVLCLIWVRDLPYYPSGDQLNTTAAAHYHLDGNFIMLKKTGYLGKFPYQKGLTLIYELLFSLFGHFCYPTAARIHILLGVITMIFGYLFVEETAAHSVCKFLYCPLVTFCAPYLILTPYTYGDLPSICFGTVLFWAMLRFSRTLKVRYAVLGCVMSALSLMVRMHSWILFIAVFIGMALVSLQQKKWAPVLAGILISVSAFGAVKLVDYTYYLRSGYEITEGAPMILSLAMGMQDNEGGPGTYNNYQTETLSLVDYDNDAAAGIARENLRENLTHFKEDLSYARWFFTTKLTMQWTEPLFETLISTHSFDDELPVPEWIERVYSGDLREKLIAFANRYQTIVYLGFLCFLPAFWKRKKENPSIWIPLITIVGGFLFSVIWETQCRYVLPYYVFMLMYVPEGLCFLQQILEKIQQVILTEQHCRNQRHRGHDLDQDIQ